MHSNNNNNHHSNVNPEREQQLKRERKRKVLQIRIGQGFKQLIKKPWKNIPVGILVALFIVALVFREKAIPMVNTLPLFLISLWGYIITAAIIVIFALLFVGLIQLLGTPREARSTENSLLQVFSNTELRYESCPILISREPYKGGAERLEFYSKGISKEAWQQQQSKIGDVLVCHFTEPITYGGKNNNNGNRIVICIGKGMKSPERGQLTDDEL